MVGAPGDPRTSLCISTCIRTTKMPLKRLFKLRALVFTSGGQLYNLRASQLPFDNPICSSPCYQELGPGRNPDPGKIIGQTPYLHLICSPVRNPRSWLNVRNGLLFFLFHLLHFYYPGTQMANPQPATHSGILVELMVTMVRPHPTSHHHKTSGTDYPSCPLA